MNLARFSLNHRSLIWMLVVASTAWGIYNYRTISRREDPDIKISVAMVITVWPGKGADDIERLVTKKLEDEIEKMGGIRELKSTTRENVSMIFVKVNYDTDIDMAWQKLRNRIDEARPNLPDGIIGPEVKDDFGDVTSMVWSLSSKTAEPRELRKWARELKSRIQELDSVGKVNLIGEQQEIIYIEGPLDSFTMYGFSPLTASKILDYHNVNMPAGYVRTADRNFRLDASGSFEILDQIRNAVLDVSRDTGHPLRVRDVFTVRRAYREPPYSRMLTNGDLSIGLDVRMKKGRNIVAMGAQVKAAAKEFRRMLPPGIELGLLHDQPRQVDLFIDNFMNNLFEGLAIVIVVMFLAMGFRSTVIVAVSLPLSILLTIALMPSFDVNLESISIAAFIIALGMLVDNAIIVTDNIYRYRESGADSKTASINGAHDLIKPVLTGTLATVLAFLPLRLLQNEMGAYIRALPIVVSISMLASFVLSMTLTPILTSSRLLKIRRQDPSEKKGPGVVARTYARMMRGGMRLRYVVVLLALAALVGAVALLPSVGFSFFPRVDRDQFTIDIWLPEGSGIERTERTVREVERILKTEDQVVSWATYVGEGGPRFHITVVPQFNTLNYARFMVNTKDKNATRALAAHLNQRFRKEIAGARVSAKSILLGIPVEAPIAIKVTGPDLDVMKTISEQIQQILRSVPGTDMVRDNMGQEVESIKVRIDSEAASMAGLSNTEVALALLTANEGLPVTDFREEEDKIPIILRVSKEDRRSWRSLEDLRVPSQATGDKVPLKAFATQEIEWSPGVIHRVGNRRTITVMSDVSGRLADDVMREARPMINALKLPPGYSLRSEGEEKERNKAFGELIVIFALIIGGLLVMMVIQFNSIKRALTILFSVPLALIGAVLGLYFSGNSFSFMAFLGVVSLAGMVIKNAVVWVEFVDRALEKGEDLADAIVDAGLKRARPILLTAGTTIGGLLPLALFGGVLWEGMAWAMAAGLALATVLTLVVIPIVFYLMFRRTAV
ncbi:MAG: efflux RND transporter permease subunit [Deltaproteobacteria bacterium]|nr:efflux RND transporter permease subunit [Deltaproteobacteria bacterium]